MSNKPKFNVVIADDSHLGYAKDIAAEMEESAKARGTGIAKRSIDYLQKKISEGKAVIALETTENKVAGFCYIESWEEAKYAANSGLLVFPKYRKYGLATKIKNKAFELSRKKYPKAKLFGLTTSLAVMKINSDLGYRPVTFSELTEDEQFWKGCQSCINYEILQNKERKNCLCTGMLFDPEEERNKKWYPRAKEAVIKRLKSLKETILMK